MGEQRRIHDAARLAMLRDTGLLERPPVPGLDRLTSLAARMLQVPTAAVSLVTHDRQVFASQLGISEPWRSIGATPLTHSFCQFVVDDDAPLIVPDARADLRVRDNGAVRDLGVLAYAGMPIRVAGQTLGSFCAIDGKPREWSAPELQILEDLAGAVASEIALIRAADDAQQKADIIRAILVVSHDAYISIDADGRVLEWNPAAEALFGWSREEVTGCDLADLIIPPELRLAHRHGLDRVRDTSRAALAGHRLELIGLNRAGRTFPIEFSLQATEVHGQLRFHAFLHDISDRRDTEEQLRRQAELIDAAPAAIIVRDTDGTVRSWNFGAEQMYGVPDPVRAVNDRPGDPAAGRPAGDRERGVREHARLRPGAAGRPPDRRADPVRIPRRGCPAAHRPVRRRLRVLRADQATHPRRRAPGRRTVGGASGARRRRRPDAFDRGGRGHHRADAGRAGTGQRGRRADRAQQAARAHQPRAGAGESAQTRPDGHALARHRYAAGVDPRLQRDAGRPGRDGRTAASQDHASRAADRVAASGRADDVPCGQWQHRHRARSDRAGAGAAGRGRGGRSDHTTASGHGLGLHIVASLAEANFGIVAHHDNVPHGSVFT